MNAEEAITTIMIYAESEANRLYREEHQHGQLSLFGDGPFKRTREAEKFSFDIDASQVDPAVKPKLGEIARKAVKASCKRYGNEFGSLLLGYPVRYGKIHDAFD